MRSLMNVVRGVVAGLVGGAIAASISLVHKGIAGIRAASWLSLDQQRFTWRELVQRP
jgi:hypothetical protein